MQIAHLRRFVGAADELVNQDGMLDEQVRRKPSVDRLESMRS